MILLTHSHWDHIAEVSVLKEQLKAPVYIHKDDAEICRTRARTACRCFSH